jgi:hypothetical protein
MIAASLRVSVKALTKRGQLSTTQFRANGGFVSI